MHDVRACKLQTAVSAVNNELVEGSRVEANFASNGEYFSGSIKAVNKSADGW